ncbi:CinY protein [Byssothecium circinans]|uniref:CinY protein n=1 Tax=Byssothecium circinans TaxID=147558 RepID=A0A6A5T9V2_9PLEO|nr:CinY protein [Byssothecium circinans]
MSFPARRNTFLAASVACLITSTSCHAHPEPFGTWNGLGQRNEHEMISRVAFQCAEGAKSLPPYDCFEPLTLGNLAGTHVGKVLGAGDNGMIGSPDDLLPEPAEAHCDDADFMDIEGYPKTRDQATQQLQACIDHLRMRFGQAVRGVTRLLDAQGVVIEGQAKLKDENECDHDWREETDNTKDKAKCVTLEGFGRALHGLQDFYAHSNWADLPNASQAVSVTNPPGLNRTDQAPFIDLRANGSIAEQVPRDLSTGCYVLIDKAKGVLQCKNRVTHFTMNKDHGIVELSGSATGDPDDVPRNAVAGNFEKAVAAAVTGSREQWANLRSEIIKTYGQEKGTKMVCALVSDNPVVDCA